MREILDGIDLLMAKLETLRDSSSVRISHSGQDVTMQSNTDESSKAVSMPITEQANVIKDTIAAQKKKLRKLLDEEPSSPQYD